MAFLKKEFSILVASSLIFQITFKPRVVNQSYWWSFLVEKVVNRMPQNLLNFSYLGEGAAFLIKFTVTMKTR